MQTCGNCEHGQGRQCAHGNWKLGEKVSELAVAALKGFGMNKCARWDRLAPVSTRTETGAPADEHPPGPFKAAMQGRNGDGAVDVFPVMHDDEFAMCVAVPEGAIRITREQARSFFDFKEET
jgi:hypothetical protein